MIDDPKSITLSIYRVENKYWKLVLQKLELRPSY